MAISELELKKEKIILNKVSELINNNIEELSKEVKANEENLIEFKKLMWQDSTSFDNAEIEDNVYSFPSIRHFPALCSNDRSGQAPFTRMTESSSPVKRGSVPFPR